MIICYLAPVCPIEVYKNMKNQNSPAAYYFNKNFAEGFATLPDVKVVSPIPPSMMRRMDDISDIYAEEKAQGYSSGKEGFGERVTENSVKYTRLNIGQKGFAYGKFCLEILKKIKKWKKKDKVVIICDALSISSAFVSVFAQYCFNIKAVAVVTDLPQHLCESGSTLKSRIFTYISLFLMRRFRSYVLLTKDMGDIVNKKKRPCSIIEGICNPKDFEDPDDFNKEDKAEYEGGSGAAEGGKRVCLYAGSLAVKYGILMLIKAFLRANIPGTELRIYGDGEAAGKVKRISKKYPNIFYGGMVPRDIIIKEEKNAALLINPRPTNREFVKYSFPSKTLEYMASGTPLLTTKLPGMPEEYYQHVYFFENETTKGYEETLKRILSMDSVILQKKGDSARSFILKTRNNRVQAEKVYNELDLNTLR